MQLHLRKAMITSPRVSTPASSEASQKLKNPCMSYDTQGRIIAVPPLFPRPMLPTLHHHEALPQALTMLNAHPRSELPARACTPSPGQLQCENSYQRFLRPLAACHGHSLRRNDSELLNTFHVFIHYRLSDPPAHYMEENQTLYSLFPDRRKVKGLESPV